MFYNKRLKKLDDFSFAEIGEVKEGTNTTKWYRRDQFVWFQLSSVTIEHYFTVNTNDYGQDIIDRKAQDDDDIKSASLVKANPKTAHSLIGAGSSKDTLAITDEESSYGKEPEDGIYSIGSPSKPLTISLCNHTNGITTNRQFPQGAYGGIAFRDSEEDRIFLQLEIPSDQLESLSAEITAHPDTTINVCVSIAAFSCELDDALREWYAPRDLFIHKTTTAAALSVSTKRNISATATSPTDQAEDSVAVIEEPQSLRPKELPNAQLATAMEKLGRLATPLWVIAILIAIQYLNK